MKQTNDTVRGDDRPMKDRGTSSGVTDTYGADLGADATNRLGEVPDTGSQPAFDNAIPECEHGR